MKRERSSFQFSKCFESLPQSVCKVNYVVLFIINYKKLYLFDRFSKTQYKFSFYKKNNIFFLEIYFLKLILSLEASA